MSEHLSYDEFGLFHENAAEYGIAYDGPPTVRRESVDLGDGRSLSALVWGDGPAELVFLHGGAQNAHTWDTVALVLGCPLVAVDLPGHGHSDASLTSSTDVWTNAGDIAVAVRALAPDARAVVGMSLGGETALALADAHPEQVNAVVLVDITPGVDAEKAKAITAFVAGPESFPSFDDILVRTVEHNPTRTEASLRRGILHNALQRPDGSWVWRYRRFTEGTGPADFGSLWDALGRLDVPLMLVRGMRPQSVVDDADEAELLRRSPHARVEHLADAGHSVQGDTPLELADLIRDFAGLDADGERPSTD